jgi:hypothetical protein
MPELNRSEVEILRRSVAMLAPRSPNGLSREQALTVLEQLAKEMKERPDE